MGVEESIPQIPVVSVQSSEIEIYFRKISELYDAGEEFPVNLDEVWMLVYSEKGKAVRTLKEYFIEGIDFNLTQNGKVINSSQIQNGIVVNYRLSVSCLEYFIARKVPEVFKVYSEVFHRTRRQMQTPKAITADQIIAIGQRMKELEIKIELDAPKVLFADTVEATDHAITIQEFSNQIWKNEDINMNNIYLSVLLTNCLFIMLGNF